MTRYIYILRNKITGKEYVGQTNDLRRRMTQHKYMAGKDNTHLHNAIAKYGWDNFEIVQSFSCPVYLVDEFEKSLICARREDAKTCISYNLQGGGCINKTFAEETREKISKARLEFIRKNGKVPYSTERLEKAKLRYSENPPFGGKRHKESSKDKISNSKVTYTISVFSGEQILDSGITVRIAAKKYNVNRKNIYACLSGITKTAKKLTFKKEI